MKFVKVVCGIIWHEGKVLIARRKAGKSLAGFWEFPGGKIEANETAEDALLRELQEEMGMAVQVVDFFGSHQHLYEHLCIELIAFNCRFINANFELTDHDQVAFIAPAQLSEYAISEADQFIVQQLAQAR